MPDRSALPSPSSLSRAVTYLATTRTGELPADPCPYCGGTGELIARFVFGPQVQDCADCDGSGVVVSDDSE